MKNILTIILVISTILLQGCINYATGNSKITHVVSPVTASKTDQINNVTAQEQEEIKKIEEDGVEEEVYPEIELKPLPLDF